MRVQIPLVISMMNWNWKISSVKFMVVLNCVKQLSLSAVMIVSKFVNSLVKSGKKLF